MPRSDRPNTERSPYHVLCEPDVVDVVNRLLDRLATELADRVERRLDGLATARQTGAGLDVKQAAARLGISERTMHDLLVTEQIPSVKVGRRRLVAASTIERLLTDGMPAAPEGSSQRPAATRRRDTIHFRAS